MANPLSAPARKRPVTIVLGPKGARLLGGYALAAMHGWFLIKLALPSPTGVLELVVGLLALTGLIASIAFFVCTYGVLANSPDDVLDEWQVAERNRAYFGAFKYVVALVIVGALGSNLGAKLIGFELSVPIMQNYLVLVFTAAMILPANLLAWRDQTSARD